MNDIELFENWFEAMSEFKEYHNANHHDGDNTFDDQTYKMTNGEDFDDQFVQDCFDHFKAGQQSQQAKIDCMQVRLDGANERALSILNHKNVMVDKMQAKIDEFKKLRSLDEMAINQLAQANQVWQVKCDELQRKYDAMYNAFTYSDDCRKEWHESYMRLKSRISEALDMLEGRQGKVLLDDIVDILKGTTNEQ